MKKLLTILVVMVVSFSVSAQHRYVHRAPVRSHVVVTVGRPFYSYYPGYFARESKLDLKINDIQADYRDRIWSAKHDNSLSKAEKRRIVHDLKREREHAINEAKRSYYKS